MSSSAGRPGASIPITTVPNLRDLGGWPADGGTVKRGLVYRCAEFSNLAGTDADEFAELGIRSVFDMRTAAEREQRPSIVPAGVRSIVVDILRDATGAAPAQLLAVLDDPQAAEALLGGGKAISMFEGAYRQIIALPSAREGYHEFFTDLADPAYLPAAFHCTTGKDRTGWGAAALLLLLGVDYDDVMTDYLLTNQQLMPSMQPLLDRFAAAGGNPALLRPVFGVQKEYLEAAMAEMEETHRDIETYFVDGLGISAVTVAALRARLIT
jgi:protein-tyrosine phosphatase